jgi:hypothetical protein
MENDRGTGPATPRSPARPASEKEEPIGYRLPVPLFRPAENEPTRRGSPFIPLESIEDDDSERVEIEATFKYRLIGLRRLPRYQRALALRAAREWRQIALKELRERRARERNARYMLWQMRLTPPIQPQ